MTTEQAAPKAHSLLQVQQHWLDRRELSDHTLRAYRFEVSRFLRWLTTLGKLGTVKPGLAELQAYLSWHSTQPRSGATHSGVRPRSHCPTRGSMAQARRISLSFLRTAATFGLAQTDFLNADADVVEARVRLTPARRAKPPALSLDVVAAGEVEGSAAELRAYLVAQLAFWVGASRTEIASMKCSQLSIELNGCRATFRDDRGRQTESWLPLSFVETLRRFHDELPYEASSNDPHLAVIPQLTGPFPLTSAAVYKLLMQIESPATAKQRSKSRLGAHMSPRSLRRQFIEEASARNWSTDEISAQLRRGRISWIPPRAKRLPSQSLKVSALADQLTPRT